MAFPIVWALSGCGAYVVGAKTDNAQLNVSASALAFGNVALNSASTQSLSLTSSGTASVTVTSVSVAGSGFAISGATFPTTLNPGQSLALQVSFDPTVAGAASGTITISSNSSGGGTTTVALSGSGTTQATPQLTISASTLAFGNVTVNTTSTKPLTLTSSGTAALTINSVGISGSGFAISGATFPATLNPGESLALQVSFDPTVAGAASGTITISSNSSGGSITTVALSGSGTTQATPQLAISAGTLAFGNVTVNTTSTKPLTLTSSGTAALTINSVGISGSGFAISGATFPATLNPGESLALQVSFDPTVAGAASGTITISSNSSGGSITTVALSGSGTTQATPQLTTSAGTLAFGNVTVNTTSTKPLTLTSSGTAALIINSVGISGSGFAISGATFPTTLNPGQSLALQVSFDPTVAGAASGTITISSNSSGGSTATVSLSGTGVNSSNPVLTLSTTTLNFWAVQMGTPLTLNLTLTSTGTSPVTVSAASVTGAGFTFAGATFPVTLNPNIAITIQVQFNPVSVGATSGTLTFTSNSTPSNSIVVTLIGTGTSVQHQVHLSWASPANSPVAVTGYNIYRALGTSNSFALLSTITGAQSTTYTDLAVTSSTTYSYVVKSFDSAGVESAPSNQVTVAVP